MKSPKISVPISDLLVDTNRNTCSQAENVLQTLLNISWNRCFEFLKICGINLDGVGAICKTLERRMQILNKILSQLEANDINFIKFGWDIKGTDWLRYWQTPTGLKPWKKRV